nr:MAG: hypothetical protein B6I27_02660 [Erwiniaceae bacterium 4572_131]
MELFKKDAEQLEQKGYKKVKVIYLDKSVKYFNLYEFDVFKKELIFMFKKKLIKIKYLKKNKKFNNLGFIKKSYVITDE